MLIRALRLQVSDLRSQLLRYALDDRAAAADPKWGHQHQVLGSSIVQGPPWMHTQNTL